MAKSISIPTTYVTPPDSEILITNHPSSASGVTPIQIVYLNRPTKMNSFTMNMIDRLAEFFQRVDKDDRVKVVVMTGSGKAFSAGIDLSQDATKASKSPTRTQRDPGGTLALAIYNCSKPSIVAYNGLAVGIAMTSNLAATIRIASAKSEFGFPFSRIGLTMESCSSFFLPRLIGYSRATYLLATGLRFKADSKQLDGLFAEVVPEPKDVLPRALEIATDIAKNVSIMALHLNRQMMWRDPGSAEAAHLIDSPLLVDMFASEDHRLFKEAFFAKRTPSFTDTITENAPRTYPWWQELSVEVKHPPKSFSKL